MPEEAKKLKTISDYEWASVARYIVYVSACAGLIEISSDAIYSFRIGQSGPASLVRRKKRARDCLTKNMELISEFVARNDDELQDDERGVIRGMYRTQAEGWSTVEGHIAHAEAIVSMRQKSLLPGCFEGEFVEDEDDFPF